MNAIDISWTIHCPAICPKRVVVLLKKCLFTFHVYSMSHIKWGYSSSLFVIKCDAQCTLNPIHNIWIVIAIQNRIYSIFDFLCFLFALNYIFHKVKFIISIFQTNSRYNVNNYIQFTSQQKRYVTISQITKSTESNTTTNSIFI